MECQSSNDEAFTFTWRIQNFSHCLERRGEHLASPTFVINSIKDSQSSVTPSASTCLQYHWRVHVYPKGEVKVNIVEDFNLCLVYVSSGRVTTSYNLEVIDSVGLVVLGKSEEAVEFTADDQYHSLQPSLSEINDIRQSVSRSHDTLIVRCSVWNIPGNIGKDVQCFASTRMGVKRMAKLWRIPSFSNLGMDLPRSTDLFLAASSSQPVLRLKAFLQGKSLNEARLQIQVFLYKCARRSLMSCKISVLDSNNRAVEMQQEKSWFSPSQEQTWTVPPFISRKYLLERQTDLLPRDVLSLKCDIEFSTGPTYHQVEGTLFGLSAFPDSMNGPWNVPEARPMSSDLRAGGFLRAHMLSLYHDKTLSDFQLKIGETVFSVHKAILSARSPVFKSLLAGDNQESEIVLISVPEIEAPTMSRMLTYIYTDTIEDMEVEDFPKLYCAASRYEINSLKEDCSSALKSGLSVKNVPMVLSVADTHQDRKLTSAAIDFILSCDGEVMYSAEWQQFLVNNSNLAAKTMFEVYTKLRKI